MIMFSLSFVEGSKSAEGRGRGRGRGAKWSIAASGFGPGVQFEVGSNPLGHRIQGCSSGTKAQLETPNAGY